MTNRVARGSLPYTESLYPMLDPESMSYYMVPIKEIPGKSRPGTSGGFVIENAPWDLGGKSVGEQSPKGTIIFEDQPSLLHERRHAKEMMDPVGLLGILGLADNASTSMDDFADKRVPGYYRSSDPFADALLRSGLPSR